MQGLGFYADSFQVKFGFARLHAGYRPKHLRRAPLYVRQAINLFIVFALVPTVGLVSQQMASAAAATVSMTTLRGEAGVVGDRYDWNFNEATAATLSKLSFGIKPGTTAPYRYLAAPGLANGEASTPDSVTNSITGDLDVRAAINPTAWSGATGQTIVAKWGPVGAQASYMLQLTTTGQIQLQRSHDGNNAISGPNLSLASVPHPGTGPVAVRATATVNNGAGGTDFNFYYKATTVATAAADTALNTGWTLLGTQTSTGTTSTFDGNSPLEIGNTNYASNGIAFKGKIYYADVRSGINSTTIANEFNPAEAPAVSGTTWKATDAIGETWTVNRSGTGLNAADIGADLSVASASGLGAAGTAVLRQNDALAVYTLAANQAVAASASLQVGLMGFINSYTTGVSGSLTSTSYDATPAAVDTATTTYSLSALSIAAGGGTGTAGGAGNSGFATAAQFSAPNQMTSDGNGNIYVADTSNSIIRKIDQYGIVSSFATGGVTLSAPLGVAYNTLNSELVIADSGASAIRKIDAGGTAYVLNASTPSPPKAVATDGTWVYYTTTDCRVYKVSINGGSNTLIAGTTSTCTTGGDGGTPASATFANPRGIAVDSLGRIFIAETGTGTTDGRVRMIDQTNNIITTVAGGGAATTDDKLASASSLNSVYAVAVAPDNEVYFATTGDHNIRKFFVGGNIYTMVGAASASAGTSTGDGGAATSATVASPRGLVLAGGTLWVADTTSNKLRKVADDAPAAPYINADTIDIAMNQSTTQSIVSNDLKIDGELDYTTAVVTVAATHALVNSLSASGQLTYQPAVNYIGVDTLTYKICDSTLMDCGTAVVTINITSDALSIYAGGIQEDTATATAGQFNAFARYRNYLYISDNFHSIIRRYDLYSKQMVIVAGTGLTISSHTDAVQAQDARFDTISGLATSPNGDLYVAAAGVHTISAIGANGGQLNRLAGNYTSAISPDGTQSILAAIGTPESIALGPDGTIYFGTTTMVRSFLVGGLIGTAACASTTGTVDGTGGASGTARCGTINGLAYNTNTNELYMADTSNHAIRKLSGGNVTTIAGTLGTSGPATATTATAATLNGPYGVAVDSSNNIYVTDTGNQVVRKFTDGGSISTIAGNAGSSGFAGDGSSATNAATRLASPQGIALGLGTDYFIGDWSNYRVRNVSTTSGAGTITTTAGSGFSSVMAGGNQAINSQLSNIQTLSTNSQSMVVNSAGTLFYLGADHTIYRIDGSTKVVTNAQITISATGVGNMTLDGSGNVIIPDAAGNSIKSVNPSTLAMTTLSITLPTSPANCGPRGINYDAAKANLYIACGTTNAIYKWDGAALTLVAGVPSASGSDSGDGGAATAAHFNGPGEVALDSTGNIYVVERNGYRVRMIDRNNVIATLVNNSGTYASAGDGGQAYNANFQSAYTIALDGAGNIFLPEAGGYKVREVDNNNNMSTAAGNGIYGGEYDTAALSAQFTNLKGLTVQGGNVFIGDDGSDRVLVAKGIANSTTTNKLASANWNVVPGASGHTGTLQQLSVKPTVDTTTSKLTFSLPTGTTASSPTVTEAYGVPTTVAASAIASNTITLSFGTAFTMKAGVNYEFTISGLSMTGVSNGSYTSGVTLYDNSGSPVQVGWARSTIVSITSGVPTANTPGFNSVWAKSSSLAVNSGAATNVTVSPSGTTSGSTAIAVQSGIASTDNLNNVNFNVSATAATSTTPAATISGITANVGTGAALTTTPNRWGTGLTTLSSTGTRAAGLTGSNYVGNTGSAQAFVTAASGANTFTLANGTFVDWLQPAGTYTTSYTFTLNGGS